MKDHVICQICGYKTRQINYSHLWFRHGIKIAEYKIRFPNAEITCEDSKELSGIAARLRDPQSEEKIARIQKTMKEKYDANPNHYFKTRNIEGENNPFFGKHHTEEMKKDLSKKTSERLLKEYAEGKRVSAFKTLGHFQGSSKLEIIVKEFLEPLGFVHNFNISFDKGNYSIDFALLDKKFGIEIDSRLHDKYKERDKRKDNFLRQLGWRIVRIDVRNKKDVETLLLRVKEVLRVNQINT